MSLRLKEIRECNAQMQVHVPQPGWSANECNYIGIADSKLADQNNIMSEIIAARHVITKFQLQIKLQQQELDAQHTRIIHKQKLLGEKSAELYSLKGEEITEKLNEAEQRLSSVDVRIYEYLISTAVL